MLRFILKDTECLICEGFSPVLYFLWLGEQIRNNGLTDSISLRIIKARVYAFAQQMWTILQPKNSRNMSEMVERNKIKNTHSISIETIIKGVHKIINKPQI